MAGLKTANSARPSSLGSPVPGKDEDAAIAEILASFDAPQMQAAAPSGEDAAIAELVNQVPGEIPEDQFAPEPGFLQANAEQFQNLGDRVMYGLSANNNEAMAKLQQKYGPQNVTMRKGEIYFRKDATQKMKRIDPDQFEIFADLIPDGARNIIMEAAMLPAEIGGGIAGAALGPGGPLVGATAGRVASVPMANAVAEGVSNLAGNVTDPSRDMRQENLIGMGVETVLPVVGRFGVNQIAKRLPGTQAYKMAKDAAKKEVVALSDQSREVLSAVRELEEKGQNLNLMAHQIQPDSPQTQALVTSARQNQGNALRQEEIALANEYKSVLEGHLNEIGRMKDGRSVNPGEVVRDAVRDIESNEAKAIGRYREKALAKLKNAKQQLPAETSQLVTESMRELGFTPRRYKVESVTRPGSFEKAARQGGVEQKNIIEKVRWTPPTGKQLEQIEGSFGLSSAGEVRAVVNVLSDYGTFISRGNEARLTDVERMINRMGPLSHRLRGTKAGAVLGQIQGDLRKHRREIIGNGLDDEFEKKAFNQAMDDFGMIRSNVEQLSDALRGDVTSKTLVSSFFKGKENLANVRAIKKIAGEDSVAWNTLKDEFTNSLLMKHGGKDSLTRYNSGAFLNELKTQYGDDFLREVYKPEDIKTLQNILTAGQRLESSLKNVKADTSDAKLSKGIIDTFVGLAAGVKFKALNGVSSILGIQSGKYNPVMELMNRDGFHKYIAEYKGPGNRSKIAANVEELLMRYNAARAAQNKVNTTLDIGKDLTKRTVRADLREDASR